MTQLTNDANADQFIFFPFTFAVITVVLHGWRSTGAGSILTADSFSSFFKQKKKKADFLSFFITIWIILLLMEVNFSQA